MIFSDDILVRVGIFILGLCGFAVAWHIFKHKNNNKNPLVCPIRFDCRTVVHSDYSRLVGIPVEILGMIYYVLIALSYFFLIFVPEEMSVVWINFMIAMSFIAFLFSVYLIGVQIFILKKGCSWCIVSAFICLLIFILTIFNYDFGFIIQIFLR